MSSIFDTLTSLVSKMGDPNRDKLATTAYTRRLITDDQLYSMYTTSWLAGKTVDIPVDDALRKWRNWDTGDQTVDAEIRDVEGRIGLQLKMLTAKKMARLWGGSAIYIGTDQDPSEPLDVDRVKKDDLKFVTVLDINQITPNHLDDDPFSPTYAKPISYTVSGTAIQSMVHPSHLVIQIGDEHLDPWNQVGRTFGWGESILTRVYEAIRQADSVSANISSLIYEANVDVFGIPDFMASIADEQYADKLLKRFTLAAAGKGINQTLLHDSSETYDRKGISFASLPDMIQNYQMMAAGAADIPFTRLMGQSPGGLNSTGESDMNNYWDKVQAMQTLQMQPAMNVLDQVLLRSVAGKPAVVNYRWSPLSQMSELDIAKVGVDISSTVESLSRTDLFTGEELRTAAANSLTANDVFPGLAKMVSENDP